MEKLKLETRVSVDMEGTLLNMKVGETFLVDSNETEVGTVRNAAVRLRRKEIGIWPINKISGQLFTVTRIK